MTHSNDEIEKNTEEKLDLHENRASNK